MVLKVALCNPSDLESVDIDRGSFGDWVLIAETEASVHGVFKSVTRSTAGTETVSAPDTGGAIYLTDLLVTSDKTNGSTVVVRFADDLGNTEQIYYGDSTNAPLDSAISFAGRFRGWKSARLEVVTTGTVTATVVCGYYKVPDALDYEDWDAER